MKEQDIYKKIHDTYNSEKGKNFITHLLRSFFPVDRSRQVMMAPTDEKGEEKKMVCCITGIKLQPLTEKLAVALNNHDDLFKGFMAGAKRHISEEKNATPLTEEEIKANEIKKEIRSIEVAIGCEKSDKHLSYAAFQQLLNFYMTEMLRDNKHINWIANNEKGKEIVKHAKKDGLVTTKKEERVVQKAVERATLSLGENAVLQNLKKKFEENGQ